MRPPRRHFPRGLSGTPAWGGERAYRVASGRTGVQAKAVIPLRARKKHNRPKQASTEAPRTWVADRTFDFGRNERHSNGLVFTICFVSDCHSQAAKRS